MGEFGAYKADVLWEGIEIRGKSFFPKNWTRKQVIQNILEAYENYIKQGLDPILKDNGKWYIKAKSNIGMEIEIFIDQKGTIKTAHPYIP